ncbi:unnamed protein product [Ostreobium quekettii]|uniref:Kinesin-like protein n=1 Tax=Ostreobium quekettii TaxID=121088 RepID=A0A8S1J5Y2_9CHLO|nr:unnamed protein product [Ostreobium quekettii]
MGGRSTPQGYRAALSSKPREGSSTSGASRPQKRRSASATGVRGDVRTAQSATPEPLVRPATSSAQAPPQQTGEGVKVIIRIRPLNQSEVLAEDCTRAVTCMDDYTLTISPDKKKQRSEEACTFTFDSVHQETSTQAEVFEEVGIPIIENVVGGYNSTIFAYGQTGAGKTHTMIGDPECGRKRLAVEGGLAPRVFQYLFKKITEEEQRKRDEYGNPEELHFSVRCSVLEIYNELITDLLNPKEVNLQVREDAQRGAFVDGLKEVHCQNASEALRLLFTGAQNRKTAHTRANSKSSRSHYIYTCFVERTSKSIDGICQTRHSRLNLVDLAGSERNNMSGATNHQLKEACHINKSLSTLGRVIKELLESQKHGGGHIPYRDSKLTYLLQESLGGNAKTTIIANISPSSISYHETLSTLQFVRRAKYIRNNARVNEDSEEKKNIEDLQREVKRLKETITNLRSEVATPAIKENTVLKGHADELQRQLDSANAANFLLKEEKQKLQEHVARLQGDRVAMKKSIDLLMRKVNDAQRSFQAVEELGGKVSETEREVLVRELQKEELERLQSTDLMDDMMRELERARETMEKQQLEVEMLYKNDAQKDASLAAVSEQLAREKDASAGLEAALDRTRAELISARDGVCLTKGEVSKREVETENLRQQLAHLNGDLNSAQRENARLNEQLTKKGNMICKLECTVSELRQLIRDTKNEAATLIEDREQENDYLRHLLDDATSRVDAAEATLAQISLERDQVRRANFSLTNFMENINDVIRDAEVTTPMGITHTIRDYEDRQGFYDVYDRPTVARSVTPKYAVSPESMSQNGLAGYMSPPPGARVEVGGSYGEGGEY